MRCEWNTGVRKAVFLEPDDKLKILKVKIGCGIGFMCVRVLFYNINDAFDASIRMTHGFSKAAWAMESCFKNNSELIKWLIASIRQMVQEWNETETVVFHSGSVMANPQGWQWIITPSELSIIFGISKHLKQAGHCEETADWKSFFICHHLFHQMFNLLVVI